MLFRNYLCQNSNEMVMVCVPVFGVVHSFDKTKKKRYTLFSTRVDKCYNNIVHKGLSCKVETLQLSLYLKQQATILLILFSNLCRQTHVFIITSEVKCRYRSCCGTANMEFVIKQR